METMQRSPERLAVLSQFYLCWCFIALICGIVMDGLLADYGLSYWWGSGLIDDSYIGFVESRFGLTAGCRLAFDLLISPYVPRYPCDASHRLAVIDDAAGNLLLDISDDAISVRAQPQR
ncbi:MAG: hypothetical protein VXX49_08540 [Pseudomonadota bacterium]|nr:hypothetical protein [Pseudomonadota bacterium]